MTQLKPRLKSKRILYLSYDGMLEPLGESQVLGYLKKMSSDTEFRFTLVSFEKKEDWDDIPRRTKMRTRLASRQIRWIPLRYHKKPVLLATGWDIAWGTLIAVKIALTEKIDVVHARSYVSSVTALFLKIFLQKRFIFDMRGFWADERADADQWSRASKVYRVVKWFERQFLIHADAVVSLTQAAVEEMKTFPYLKNKNQNFAVIPTCANLELFREKKASSSAETFWLGHVGSIGAWYLFDEALLFFKALKKINPGAKLLILNRNEHAKILAALDRHAISPDSFELKSAHHEEMPNYLARLSGSVFFIKPFYSKKASAPTKLAELLGSGIPCVVNSGVGDMDLFFRNHPIGVCVSGYHEATLEKAATEFLRCTSHPETSEICRQTALRYFSVDQGARDYLQLYRQILLPE